MTAAATPNAAAETTEATAQTAPAKPNRNLTVAEWRTVYAGRRQELRDAVERQDWPRVEQLAKTLQRVMNAAAKAALAEQAQA